MMVRITAQQMELLHYNDIDVRQYFWQTTQQQEIDFIEESHDQWATFKFKRNAESQLHFHQTLSKVILTLKRWLFHRLMLRIFY